MIKLFIVFGTRPEVIKLAPVIKELQKYPDRFICRLCVTAQHRQMLDQFLDLFGITPDYDLNIMQEDQNLDYIISSVLDRVGEILKNERPDYLLVQGDTTTAMAASLAAFYRKVKIVHVEAGLRTWDIMRPYPEEANRKIIDAVSDLHFCHTEQARQNLLEEGVDEKGIVVTGNTVIDALLDVAHREVDPKKDILESLPLDSKRIILLTAHRRENFGRPLEDICSAVKEIAERFPDIYIIYPVHLNPRVRGPVRSILGGVKNILLTEPLDYEAFVHVVKKAYLILTDSGGLQEEAPSLGKPVLVLRDVSERQEGIASGALRLAGTRRETIIKETKNLLENTDEYTHMSRANNPYGDGKSAQRIVWEILKRSA